LTDLTDFTDLTDVGDLVPGTTVFFITGLFGLHVAVGEKIFTPFLAVDLTLDGDMMLPVLVAGDWKLLCTTRLDNANVACFGLRRSVFCLLEIMEEDWLLLLFSSSVEFWSLSEG